MAKKQLIMEKALELFAAQGFESTSVQQITEHCGISKGAFYLAFKSKDELVVALIDHFMMQFISDIDHSVKNVTNNQQLLYNFYYATFNSFYKHSDFAKVLMKEQSQTINNHELILKMRYYDQLLDKIILAMIKQLYDNTVEQIQYDLLYCIKGLIRIYSELFIFSNVQLDLDLLSKSLEDKTKILASNMTVPFITSELIQLSQLPINEEELSPQHIVKFIDQKIEELGDSVEKESLLLIKDHILEPRLPQAIVIGLLGNIQHHPHLKWVSYLLRNYLLN
ncbi:TetR/AcrR family transcriptional regulator [Bacillus suaedaesalsae]|uniref:TetR/AcrR family transcriptional regulator n=1 Tax=Bacillus suaedaesalsae TaxID=2810349 RepID=A0ABS2DEH2_9BACI|nr:TetR/AcrR family transcriptional regulator [Bacillus suaedaesalsae]MBM6616855.1 TetR/AcrR family transcriptional regulator [Bacillus suaedaesalsae]